MSKLAMIAGARDAVEQLMKLSNGESMTLAEIAQMVGVKRVRELRAAGEIVQTGEVVWPHRWRVNPAALTADVMGESDETD